MLLLTSFTLNVYIRSPDFNCMRQKVWALIILEQPIKTVFHSFKVRVDVLKGLKSLKTILNEWILSHGTLQIR